MPSREIPLPHWASEVWFRGWESEMESAIMEWEGVMDTDVHVCWGMPGGEDRAIIFRSESNGMTVYETVGEAVLSTRFKTLCDVKSKKPRLTAEVAELVVDTGRDPAAVLADLLDRQRLADPALDWVDEMRVLGVLSDEDAARISQRLKDWPYNKGAVGTEDEEVMSV